MMTRSIYACMESEKEDINDENDVRVFFLYSVILLRISVI